MAWQQNSSQPSTDCEAALIIFGSSPVAVTSAGVRLIFPAGDAGLKRPVNVVLSVSSFVHRQPHVAVGLSGLEHPLIVLAAVSEKQLHSRRAMAAVVEECGRGQRKEAELWAAMTGGAPREAPARAIRM